MDWIPTLIFLVALYAAIAWYIHSRKLWQDHIIFYGPIMAIKTNRVQFFDRFIAWRTFFRIYGTVGVIAVVIVSVLITAMLFISIRYTLLIQPEPTGIYEPQNILLIPGVNQYVPSTIAVWLAFIITIGIHEFGHAILCRVENIRVKGMGALVAVIPIGFFVEPDEEELDRTKGMPKMRMFGAGITNNLVFGFACFAILILAFGMVVPSSDPVIYGVYKNYSADQAGVPPDSVIKYIGIINTTSPGTVLPAESVPVPVAESNTGTLKEEGTSPNLIELEQSYLAGMPDPSPEYRELVNQYVRKHYIQRSYGMNTSSAFDPFSTSLARTQSLVPTPDSTVSGITRIDTPVTVSPQIFPVASRTEVSSVLNMTRPGDQIVLGVEKDGIVGNYTLKLTQWPAEAGVRESGFMGVTYYDGALVKTAVQSMFSPVGFFQFLIIPFGMDQGTQFLRIIAFETPDTRFYNAPFEGFWGVMQLLFWCAWININVGIFNAIPMVPLDGGYIFKESVDRLLDRRGLIRYSSYVVSTVSFVLVMVLMSLIFLPYLLHLPS